MSRCDFKAMGQAAEQLAALCAIRDGAIVNHEWDSRFRRAMTTIMREWQNSFPEGTLDDYEISSELGMIRDALRGVAGPTCDSAFNDWVGNRPRQKPTKLKDVQPVCTRAADRLNRIINQLTERGT
jgi:hypothetical protein